MYLGQLDVAIRAGASVTILLLAWLLLAQRRQAGLPAVLFAPLALCLTGFVVTNSPLASLTPTGVIGRLAHTVSGFTVIFLWWFCLSCFDRQFRLKGGILGVGLLWATIAALDRGLLGDAFADKDLSRLLVPLGFAIVGHLVWRLLGERPGDLIPQRQDARIRVAALLGGMLFIDLTADTLFGFAWRPLAFAMIQNAMLLSFGLWLTSQLLSVRSGVLTFSAGTNAPSATAIPLRPHLRPDDERHHRLLSLMEKDRVFLDPELSFATFVARMGTSERAVRTLINQELGYDHFRTFLNHYRVAEARRLLRERDPADKLIAIALDSGFASLASFNRAFRTIEGRSPSDFRAAVRRDESSVQPGIEERKDGF